MVVGVIFDVDGTLVTFQFDVRGTRKALIDELGRRGFDIGGLDLTTPTQRILDAAKEQADAGEGSDYEALRKSVFSILDAFEAGSAASTSPLPGVGDALDYLRSRGARLAVLTNSGRRAARESLGRAGILDRFEFVFTRDDTVIMKPRPEGLRMAAARFRLPTSSVCYVGDSIFDVQAGRAAGIRVVSVATGNFAGERLGAEGADAVIKDLSELGAVLGLK